MANCNRTKIIFPENIDAYTIENIAEKLSDIGTTEILEDNQIFFLCHDKNYYDVAIQNLAKYDGTVIEYQSEADWYKITYVYVSNGTDFIFVEEIETIEDINFENYIDEYQ